MFIAVGCLTLSGEFRSTQIGFLLFILDVPIHISIAMFLTAAALIAIFLDDIYAPSWALTPECNCCRRKSEPLSQPNPPHDVRN